jgi:hypothetical protein
MNTIGQAYRQACREIDVPPREKDLFMWLLREIGVNAVRSQKAWNVKEDFLALWFISAGRFPELADSPYSLIIGNWVGMQLPFELTADERRSLWI